MHGTCPQLSESWHGNSCRKHARHMKLAPLLFYSCRAKLYHLRKQLLLEQEVGTNRVVHVPVWCLLWVQGRILGLSSEYVSKFCYSNVLKGHKRRGGNFQRAPKSSSGFIRRWSSHLATSRTGLCLPREVCRGMGREHAWRVISGV